MASLIFKKLRAILNDNLLLNGNFDIWQRGTPFYAAVTLTARILDTFPAIAKGWSVSG